MCIRDSSFGDENISTSGTLASGAQTITGDLTASGIVSAEQLTSTDDLTVADEASIDGTMTLSSGSITDLGGSISFGNENLETTGTISVETGSSIGNLTLSDGSITDSGGSISFVEVEARLETPALNVPVVDKFSSPKEIEPPESVIDPSENVRFPILDPVSTPVSYTHLTLPTILLV